MDHPINFVMNENPSLTIGCIGQGWIGRNYADAFEERGFPVVRYALEPEYENNKERIAECDIVVIAVPTPTTPEGFDDSIVQAVLPLVGAGKVAVIKSTITPGSTKRLQEMYPDIMVMFSPEFLSEATAAHDVRNPFISLVGVPVETVEYKEAAQKVLDVLPPSPVKRICGSTEAEIFKYAHNVSGFVQIVFFNALYDLSQKLGADWQVIQEAAEADPFISNRYAKPLHKSGRGAGGHCFIKDFAALRALYQEVLPEDRKTIAVLNALEEKNIELLMTSRKDLDLLEGVYGKDRIA
jgi:nucleotide sugar dehydrogenase